MSGKKLNIYEYKCFRTFVKDAVDTIKLSNPEFSHRKFSKAAGFKSPSILTGIISGKSGLSRQGARKLALGLGLGTIESKFFVRLVDLANAKSPADYAATFQLLLKDVRFSEAHPLAAAEFRYYRKWFYPVIRELLVTSAMSINQIHDRLRWPVAQEELLEALSDLKNLGFVTEADGQFSAVQRLVMTSPEAPMAQLGIFQRQMIEKAAESLEDLPSDRRDIRSSTLSIDKELFPELKVFLHQVLVDAMERFEGQSTKKDLVLQINTQAFPLTRF